MDTNVFRNAVAHHRHQTYQEIDCAKHFLIRLGHRIEFSFLISSRVFFFFLSLFTTVAKTCPRKMKINRCEISQYPLALMLMKLGFTIPICRHTAQYRAGPRLSQLSDSPFRSHALFSLCLACTDAPALLRCLCYFPLSLLSCASSILMRSTRCPDCSAARKLGGTCFSMAHYR